MDPKKEGMEGGPQKIGAPLAPDLLKHEEPKLIKETEGQRISDLEDQMKRLQAEFENYKKRTGKERETLMMAGSAATIIKLLPVLDEMEVATAAMIHDPSSKSLKHGVEMLHKKFIHVLEKEGLSEMKALGESFDPYRHEAVRTVEGKEDGKITEIMKKGYLFKGNVLRHAMVVVSKKVEEGKEGKTQDTIPETAKEVQQK